MIIYQTKPRLVFLSNGIVHKYFESAEECKIEVEKLLTSPLFEVFDKNLNYYFKFVKVENVSAYFYTMNFVKGVKLSACEDKKYYRLAGAWLRIFHNKSINKKTKKVFLFGDFSSSHIYINEIDKEITTIDPGAGFGEINYLEYDIGRLIVDLFQTHSLNLFKLNKSIDMFFEGYCPFKIDYERLTKIIMYRIKRNFRKRINLSNRRKKYLSAFYWLLLSAIKYFCIKYKFKNK